MAYMQNVREHTFRKTAYKSHNDSSVRTHTVYEVCSGCGFERSTGREEEHEYYQYSRPSRNPGVCKKCGQGESHEHQPDFIYFCGYVPINDKQHAEEYLCCYCDLSCTNRVYDHDFDLVTMKCKDCGYPAEDCDHTFERIAKPEGDHHILNGQCTKCEDRAVLLSGAEHEFEDDVANGAAITGAITQTRRSCPKGKAIWAAQMVKRIPHRTR